MTGPATTGPTVRRDWMDWGTASFLGALDRLGDDELDAPTVLPGWTRRHVVAHVHQNADALRRLVSWARTGIESPMYPGATQRDDDIETGSTLPATDLREHVRTSTAALAADLDALDATIWRQPVVTAQGRTVPATEIVWMRTREVVVHAIDLAAGDGFGFGDVPADLAAALLGEILARRIGHGETAMLGPWLTGQATDAPSLAPWI